MEFDDDEIKKNYTYFKQSLNTLLNSIDERLALLDKKEKVIKKNDELVAATLSNTSEIIKLNVGGKQFETFKSTLTSIEGTYFHALLSSGRWMPGAYFIDRNPKYFNRILDFLRTKKFSWEGLGVAAVTKLVDDIDYYQIPVPPPLTWNSNMCGNNLIISNGGTTVTRANSANAWNSAVLGSSRVPEFQVKIEETGHMMIGLASSNGFQIHGKNHVSSGYWMYAITGNLYSAKDSGRLYFNRLSNGDTVTVIYNQKKKEINFEVNGNDCGIAFEEVNEELYPAVEMWGPGTVSFVM